MAKNKEKIKFNWKQAPAPLIISAALSVIIAILSFGLNDTAFYKSFENLFQKEFFNWQNSDQSIYANSPYLRDFVSVEIDDRALSALNTRWPIPRSYYAKLIEKLRNAGAKLICFDIIFPDKSTPDEDRAFAQQLKDTPDILLAYHFADIRINPDASEEKETFTLIPPYAPLFDSLGKNNSEKFEKLGFVTTATDEDVDGLIRCVTFVQNYRGKTYSSFDVKILAKVLGAQPEQIKYDEEKKTLLIKDKFIRLNNDNSITLNFGITPKSKAFIGDIISMSDVFQMSDQDIAGYFKDKIVLIGVSATAGHDIKYFPVGSMPGMYGHFNAVFTVLENKFIHPATPRDYIYWALLFGIIGGLLFFFVPLKPRYSIIILLVFLTAAIFTGYKVFIISGKFMPMFPTIVNIALIFVSINLYKHQQEEHAKKKLSKMLREFAPLPPDFLENVIAQTTGSAKLGGQKVEVSILFSDIRGYTNLSEKLDPVEVMNTLNEYHSAMGEIFEQNGGVIFDYQGDAQMVVFGLVEPSKENHAFYAVKAGLEMQERVSRLMEKWGAERHGFEVGVGVCTGPVSLGVVGSAQRKQYAAIGDSTNVSARLQGMSKQLESPVLISEPTYLMCKDNIEADKLEPVHLKGKSEPLQVYRAKAVIEKRLGGDDRRQSERRECERRQGPGDRRNE